MTYKDYGFTEMEHLSLSRIVAKKPRRWWLVPLFILVVLVSLFDIFVEPHIGVQEVSAASPEEAVAMSDRAIFEEWEGQTREVYKRYLGV